MLTAEMRSAMADKKKHKESATLRFRKLSDGRQSIYLDIRVDGNRQYRTLGLYLLPETDFVSRQKNRETLQQAEKIKEETIIEKMYARAGLDDRSFLGQTKLVDWMQRFHDKQTADEKSETIRRSVLRLKEEIRSFDPDITLEEVDLDFANNFAEYLRTRDAMHATASGKMCNNSVLVSLSTVSAALNYARRERIIHRNPFLDARFSSMREETHLGFLTPNEVCRLMDAYCSKPALKTAFMFSCFTGLRYSDVMALTWKNVIMDGDHWRLELNQVKTGEFVSIPLSKMAVLYLPKYKKSYSKDRKVFERIEQQLIKTPLERWAKLAGITKKLTFHMSRHTFACLCIEAGIDIYTICKLLGHRSIKSTQVYSDVMDGRKESAVSLLDQLDLLKDMFDDDTEEPEDSDNDTENEVQEEI